MTDRVYEAVSTVLAHEFGIVPEAMRPETRLVEDLDFDSLELVSFAQDLEEKLGISIPDGSIQQHMTIGDVIEELRKIIN